jgi:hypothetical protein
VKRRDSSHTQAGFELTGSSEGQARARREARERSGRGAGEGKESAMVVVGVQAGNLGASLFIHSPV